VDSTLFAVLSFVIPGIFVALELTSQEYRETFMDRERMARNGAYLLASAAVINFVKQFNLWMVPMLPTLPLGELPIWLDIVGCILFAELVNYVLHYVKHKSSFLWKFHFQHHIETKFNMWLLTHTHGLEVVISASLIAALSTMVGFSAFALSVYLLIYNGAKAYQHSTYSYSLGWLDYIMIGPRMHRLHHAVGLDVNYGTMLTIYDVLFGTAAWPSADDETEYAYGIVDHGEPFGFVPEMLYFLRSAR